MVIVESHHKVLTAWAKYRATLNKAPRLLTFDHHTDTSKPFRNYINKTYGVNYEKSEELRRAWLQKIDYKNEQSVLSAMEKISNDEHVVTAIKSDIISSALVVAHNAQDTDLSVYDEHKIICLGVGQPNAKQLAREDYDKVLESEFLEETLMTFNVMLKTAKEVLLEEGPYILDIDLDYLNTFNSVKPKDANVLKNLARNAGLITVATEPEYVKSCAIDSGLTSETLLSSLQDLLK